MDNIIELVNLKHRIEFSGNCLEILKGIDLKVKSGQSLAIVGASGSGKSTLLGMMAGLDVPSEGKIYLKGQDISQLNEEQRAATRLQNTAFVFQDFQLLESLTTLENVALPLEIKQHPEPRQEAQRFLEQVGLQHRLRHYPHQLSGGEQQRTALARAFACQAPVLFADEPTGNLDSSTGHEISDLLFELNKNSDTTLILVTHDLRLAERCERQVQMLGGRLVETQT